MTADVSRGDKISGEEEKGFKGTEGAHAAPRTREPVSEDGRGLSRSPPRCAAHTVFRKGTETLQPPDELLLPRTG